MKHYLIACLAFCCLLMSSSVYSQSAKAKKNLEVVHAINKAVDTDQFDELDKWIAQDAVDHSSPTGGTVKGLENIKKVIREFRSKVENPKMDVIKEVADENYVFQMSKYSATTKDDSMGMPAGTDMNMTAVSVIRMENGKAVEYWEFINPADMMKMMSHHGDKKSHADKKGHEENKMDSGTSE